MSRTSCNKDFSEDAFLNGRVRLFQPKNGYRAAIDPVLLAAAVPAKAGQFCLELGLGGGAAALCLLARLPGLGGIAGLEIDPGQVELAQRNAEMNAAADRLHVALGDAAQPPASLPRNHFDHVFMNPPYLEAMRHDPPPDAAKRQAHLEKDGALQDWIASASKLLKPRGTLTLIHRADRLPAILAALEAKFGSVRLLPLWPRQGEAAQRLIVQAVKGGKGAFQLLAGLTLHADQGYTQEAEAILRHAGPIEMNG